MERPSERIACAECGADVTAEPIKFQREDGSSLCEECYMMRGKARFGHARGIVVALRLAAFTVLALTFIDVVPRLAVRDYAVLQIALYGALAFLLFFSLSEGIEIVLALNRQTLENRIKLDRILELLDGKGVHLSDGDSSQTI